MDPIRLRTKLDEYYREVQSVIVRKQHPVTGLLPASTAVTVHGDYRDAWVRDNVYSIQAVWALSLAYRRLDDDGGRGFELEHRTVHLMRSLLRSMMMQVGKVEAFKRSRRPHDALHAKYDTETGGLVVGDGDWGHLQIDATSLYLLSLSQMIASGLDVIWTSDEVNFIQNLIYYIERAYRTPDYGIWERGAKSNQGRVEINASSVGMALAALEALSGFDLFGARGSQASVVHVLPDNVALAHITLSSMLPRESYSKETDAALLGIIGYPAYAVQPTVARRWASEIVGKLEGRYGLKRFLRDGHQTVVEDEARLHYEPQELRRFENIESEWPLFFAYLYLDAAMAGDAERASHYAERLRFTAVERDGRRLLPELYFVPESAIAAERAQPGSQERVPNDNVPLVWAQSLYLLGRMLEDGVIDASDLDPLGRRHRTLPRRPVVQVAFVAEDEALQAELAAQGVLTETFQDIAPLRVHLPQDLAEAYGEVGRNDALGLTGRSARALKSLTTSRMYRLGDRPGVCLASFFMQREFFLAYDLGFLVRRFESELAYLHRHWTQRGRPTVTVLLTRDLLGEDRTPFYEFAQKLASGRVGPAPVRLGRLVTLASTASFERIDDLHGLELPENSLERLVRHQTALPEPDHHVPLSSDAARVIELADAPLPLVERLSATHNLYEQIELLDRLSRLQPLSREIPMSGSMRTLAELIEEVYDQSGRLRLWAIVRRAAGLLGKVDGDLNLAVGALLVQQKMIQVGRAYSDESLIAQPLPDDALLDKIDTFCRDDVRDRVLTQELILYLSLLIKARPELFSELLTIRVGYLIVLLSSQLAREGGLQPDEGYEALMHLAPSLIQARLEGVLAQYAAIETLPQELEHLSAHVTRGTLDWEQDLGLEAIARPPDGWLSWRQHRGVIDRRPPNFYADTWRIFQHVSGLVVGDKLDRRNRMDSSIVLSDMTPGEATFALWLEHLLNKVPSPEYRQLNLESLRALASFFAQNPSLTIDGVFALDALIGHAVRLAYVDQHPGADADYGDHKSHAWQAFYASSPAETTGYLVASLRSLLLVRAA